MATGTEKELEEIKKMLEGAVDQFNDVFKRSAKRMTDEVVDLTPTYFAHESTSGNMKANWRVAKNGVDETYKEDIADYTGQETKAAIHQQIGQMKLDTDDEINLSNTGPQGKLYSIEFGGYPNPPRLGSYNTLTGEYEIRSAGGFSKQAPAGIVGVSALRWSDIVDEEAQKSNK